MIDKSDEGGVKSVLLHFGDTIDSYEVKVPKPSYEWVVHDPNTEKGDPIFDILDNPVGWSSFSYRPVLAPGAKGFQYKFLCLPSG